MTARRLQAVTRIRPGEGRTASALLTMRVVGMTGAAVGANGVESLFFSHFGPGFLPYLYLVLGPLTFAVMMGMRTVASEWGLGSWCGCRWPWGRRCWWPGPSWGCSSIGFYAAMWLVIMVLWTTQVLGFSVCDTRQAKRLFPLYGTAVIAG